MWLAQVFPTFTPSQLHEITDILETAGVRDLQDLARCTWVDLYHLGISIVNARKLLIYAWSE